MKRMKRNESAPAGLVIRSLAAMVSGLWFGHYFPPDLLHSLMPLALFLMLFPVMLDLDTQRIRADALRPGLLLCALGVNLIISPLLIYALSILWAGILTPPVRIAYLLFGLIPCGGMVPAFTALIGGNKSLAVAVSASSLLLSIVLVPLWAWLLIGIPTPGVVASIFKSLILFIAAPMLLAALTRKFTIEHRGPDQFEAVKRHVRGLPALGLILVLFIMFGVNGSGILGRPLLVLSIVPPACSFLICLIAISTISCRCLRLRPRDSVAFTISVTAKNNAVAVGVAATSLGPEVCLVAAIVGPVVQLPLMLCYLRWMEHRRGHVEKT